MNVFDLAARLTLDSSEYDRELDEAGKSASGFGNKLKTALKVGGAAVAATSAAIAGVSAALVKGVGDIASYGDNIDKMSQKMGMSAQAYQEWDAVMQHSGTSIESLRSGMKTLANAVESGNEAFARLGITEEQIQSLNNEELFSATITALQGVENETERTYLAGQLLGRGATELGALLNTSAEDTQAMKNRVHELGGVMSDEAVKAAAKYTDSLQDMKTAFSGLKRGVMSDMLPAITTIMDGLTSFAANEDGSYEFALDSIKQGIDEISGKIAAKLPGILEFVGNLVSMIGEAIVANLPTIVRAGLSLITALGEGIMQNLPTIMDTAIQVITMLSSYLIESLPVLLRAGVQIILSLSQGIAQALPELIPTIVDVILEIVDILTNPDTLSALVDASIAIMIALAEGLIEALPKLIEKAPEIIQNLVAAIVENVPKLLEAAYEVVATLVKGIWDNISDIYDAGTEILTSIWQGIKDVIVKVYEVGKDIIGRIWEGIQTSDVYQWGRDKLQELVNGFISFFQNIFQTGKKIIEKVHDGLTSDDPVGWAIDMISEFIDGVVGALGDVWNAGKKIVDKVWEGIKSLNPAEWGKDLINNFTSGISKAWETGKNAVTNVAQTVSSLLGFSEPEEGPLSDFHTYAPDMMKLFAQGVRDNAGLVTDAVESAFNFEPKIRAGFDANGYAIGQQDSGPQTIIVQSVLDGRVIGETAYNYSRDRKRMVGA